MKMTCSHQTTQQYRRYNSTDDGRRQDDVIVEPSLLMCLYTSISSSPSPHTSLPLTSVRCASCAPCFLLYSKSVAATLALYKYYTITFTPLMELCAIRIPNAGCLCCILLYVEPLIRSLVRALVHVQRRCWSWAGAMLTSRKSQGIVLQYRPSPTSTTRRR